MDAFNLQPLMANKCDIALAYELKSARKLAILSGFFVGLSQLCQFGAQALNLWCGGRAFVHREIQDVGTMLQATFTIIIASMGIGQSMTTATDTYAGKAAAQRIFSFLDLPVFPDARNIDDGVFKGLSGYSGNLHFQNVSFSYPSTNKKHRQVSIFLSSNLAVEIDS